MVQEEHETLEPPVRKSIDDPGAHDLGKTTTLDYNSRIT